jgi:dTDP-4-amino-4,6-dideoxygalactose transaminase
MAIPFINMQALNNHLLGDFQKEVAKLFQGGQFILGAPVQKFEEQFAKYIGVRYGIGVNSGTDALLLALNALNIGPGDEVICPAFTFGRCADVIARLGATPVFVDVRPDTYTIDADLAHAAINARTKAIVAVHLFGQAADIEHLTSIARTYSVAVLEDMRHAAGARVNNRRLGTWGQMGCFSYYPTRTLGAAGDAGMITTNDEKAAERLRRLREHGHAPGTNSKGTHDMIGYNSRLDAIQAILLSLKLPELDDNNMDRVANARYYNQLFRNTPVVPPQFREDGSHVYNMYTVLAPDRDALANHLTEQGIGNMIYYPTPLHLQPAFEYLGYKQGAFPVAEDLARRAISLPISPGLTKHNLETVANAVLSFYSAKV